MRGLRAALLAIEELRGDLFRLAARVVALEEELVRRVPAEERDAVQAALDARTPELVKHIQAADVGASERLLLGDAVDKYAVPPLPGGGPPCLELLPICNARCCTFDVPLGTQDLDEGVLRWDEGTPYLLAHDGDGRCAHLSPDHACTSYAQRPAVCRAYDCREDRRVWIDYERRIPAPADERPGDRTLTAAERHERAAAREVSLMIESRALRRR